METKSAEEILKEKLTLELMRFNNSTYTFNKVIEAMDEYSEQNCDQLQELHMRLSDILKPLEDLWRKENSPDRYSLPDSTEFYKWIVSKIIK